MSTTRFQVVYIAHCSFIDKEGESIYYNRALIRSEDEGGVSYQLVKCTNGFAEDFKEFNTFGTPLFDLRGRLTKFIAVG